MSNRIYGKAFSHNRKNPNWLVRAARWLGKRRRLDALFRHYLQQGKSRKEAWDAAGRTVA